MPKSKIRKICLGEFRTMSFACGKEAVQGSIPKMRIMRRLHKKRCELCSKTETVDLITENTNETNGISGLNAGFTNLNKFEIEEEKLDNLQPTYL